MIWAAFSYTGKTPVCFISTKMTSEKYIKLLEDVLIIFADDYMDDSMIFQQGIAAIHRSNANISFLKERNIHVFDWPALSPDLNPIKNVWGLLSQKVFKHGRQFDKVADLKKAIVEEWNDLDHQNLKRYIESMPRRLEEVISKREAATHN